MASLAFYQTHQTRAFTFTVTLLIFNYDFDPGIKLLNDKNRLKRK